MQMGMHACLYSDWLWWVASTNSIGLLRMLGDIMVHKWMQGEMGQGCKGVQMHVHNRIDPFTLLCVPFAPPYIHLYPLSPPCIPHGPIWLVGTPKLCNNRICIKSWFYPHHPLKKVCMQWQPNELNYPWPTCKNITLATTSLRPVKMEAWS